MYTELETQELLTLYAASDKSAAMIKIIAERTKRTEKSIIAKLVREGVYQKTGTATQKTRPMLKSELTDAIAEMLELAPKSLQSLDKASKDELLALYNALRNLNLNDEAE